MLKTDLSFTSLREIHLKWLRLYTRILSQAGLTLPKYSLLSQLSRCGDISMTEASGRLYISKPALTNLVKRMEKDHLIQKTGHPRDHRSTLLHLLPKGKRIVFKAQKDVLKIPLATLSTLKPAEKAAVEKFFSGFSVFMDKALCLPRGKCCL